MKLDKKVRITFTLKPSTIEMIRNDSAEMGLSMASYLELIVREHRKKRK